MVGLSRIQGVSHDTLRTGFKLKKKSIFFLEERVHPILLGHSISNGRLINE